MNRILYAFGIAGLVAAVVTLSGYLFSRDTSFATYFDEHWDLIFQATGLLILGLLIIGGAIAMYYSADGAFLPFVVLLSLGLLALGGYLVYIGIGVITHMSAVPRS